MVDVVEVSRFDELPVGVRRAATLLAVTDRPATAPTLGAWNAGWEFPRSFGGTRRTLVASDAGDVLGVAWLEAFRGAANHDVLDTSVARSARRRGLGLQLTERLLRRDDPPPRTGSTFVWGTARAATALARKVQFQQRPSRPEQWDGPLVYRARGVRTSTTAEAPAAGSRALVDAVRFLEDHWQDQPEPEPWDSLHEDVQAEIAAGGTVVVVRTKRRIIGATLIVRVAGSTSAQSMFTAVAVGERRRGAGRELRHAACAWAYAHRAPWLYSKVHPENDAMLALLLTSGAERVPGRNYVRDEPPTR